MSVDDEAQPAKHGATICQFRILLLSQLSPFKSQSAARSMEMRERLALGVKSQIFGKPS
jgi:hypothetical protein